MQPAPKRLRTEEACEPCANNVCKAWQPPIPCTPGQALTASPEMIRRLLSVIENEVLPKTEKGVAAGNKVFGAAVLDGRSPEMPTLVAETNHETLCPLYHGEIYTIKQWSETLSQADRPAPAESIFLSTHEPCCMCISAIVWSGFKKIFYFFPYEASRDQGIPHDINIMQELWQVPRYAACNKFCTSVGLLDLIDECEGEVREELRGAVKRITERYEELAHKYHAEKKSNPNNTLAFN